MNQAEWTLSWKGAAWQIAAALLAFTIFPAAADDGKSRFVAGTGRDTGDCLNRFRPCRTLSYAVAQAGKGDSIQVAEGQYAVEDSQQLFDLLAVNGRIAAGFSKYSGYSEQNASPDTVLVGVPAEFRERFEAAGFTVIVDTKGLDVSQAESQKMRKFTAQIMASEQSHAATPCVGNQAAGFACQSIGLHSHVSLRDLEPSSTRGNDVWGFTDLNTGREYALMGLQNGVAVMDITNPQAPEQIGAATGTSTIWRDIKVYQRYDQAAARWRAYAYATADSVNDFLMVLDLSGLPNSIEKVGFSSDFRAAHNAYLVDTDFTYGLPLSTQTPQLGIAGAGVSGGRYRLYGLSNPRSPQLLSVSSSGYAHDLASFAVTDARKNTQCFAAQTQAQCQVLADFNETTVDLWDVTNAAAPQRLSSQPYANAAYVHSGWPSEDARYLFVHDELDERNFGLNTTIRVFDISNLRAPTLAGAWVGPTGAIDHNGFVRGNRYYTSNYSEGLTVLDLSNPASPVRVGYFDTYPASSLTEFVGAWGVYPFFPSGTIALADINSGLYLLSNQTLTSANGSFTMASPSLTGIEGQSLTISVNREGGSVGTVAVQVETLNASTTSADAALSTSTLTWADGDTQPKTVTLNLIDDALDENLELVLLRLKAPQGGASIAYPETTQVLIGDAGASTTLQLLDSALTVDQSRGKALITVTRQGSAAGEARVSYRTVANGSYGGFTATDGELIWTAGDAAAKIISVPLNNSLSSGQQATFQVELSNAVNADLPGSGGIAANTVLASVTVAGPSSSTTPPPSSVAPTPPSGGGAAGGGGGSNQLAWLVALTLLLGFRQWQRKKESGH